MTGTEARAGRHPRACAPPFLQFYAPLFFWLGGAFYAVTGSASESLLAMLNVGRIINDTGRSRGFDASFPAATDEPPLGRVIHLAAAAPVVFAPTLAPIDLPPAIERPLVWHESFRGWTDPQVQRMSAFLDRVLETMQYQPAQRMENPSRRCVEY